MQVHGWKPEPVLLVEMELSLNLRLTDNMKQLRTIHFKCHKHNGNGRFLHPAEKEPLIFYTSGKQHQDGYRRGKIAKSEVPDVP